MTLAGSTAVVTGASRGIGRAIALRLADAGAEIALWARSGDALRDVAAEISARGGKAHAIVVDVTRPAGVIAAAELVRRVMKPVKTIVNNAGSVLRKATAEITDDEWRSVLATNLDGTFHVTRAFLPDLTRAGGRIINIASRGQARRPPLLVDCAAKNCRCRVPPGPLRRKCALLRSVLNAICPGSVDRRCSARGCRMRGPT